MPLARPAFALLGHETQLLDAEVTYFQLNCWGAGAAIVAAAYSSFYTGRGNMRVVMIIDVLASAVDLVFDYAWIFGKWGFPEMGIAGGAWATVVAQWFKVVVYWYLMRAPKLRETYALDQGRRLDLSLFTRLLKFGGPNGMQMALEGLAFTVFVVYVARLGTDASAATTLAISINIVAFVPMIGAGIAVSTLVGQYLGADNVKLATRAVWSGLWLSLAYNLIFAVLYVATPDMFLAAHRAGGVESNSVPTIAVLLLRFVAAYCLFDAVQLMLCSAIKGAGDTHFVLLTTVATSAGAVIMLELGIKQLNGGLFWCWTVLMLWVFSLAFAYAGRFLHGGWKNLRVIEPVAE
jgi:MATE family multidrug resistance protein